LAPSEDMLATRAFSEPLGAGFGNMVNNKYPCTARKNNQKNDENRRRFINLPDREETDCSQL